LPGGNTEGDARPGRDRTRSRKQPGSTPSQGGVAPEELDSHWAQAGEERYEEHGERNDSVIGIVLLGTVGSEGPDLCGPKGETLECHRRHQCSDQGPSRREPPRIPHGQNRG
jgi:hypothetical protein